jgi:hypothetical protein
MNPPLKPALVFAAASAAVALFSMPVMGAMFGKSLTFGNAAEALGVVAAAAWAAVAATLTIWPFRNGGWGGALIVVAAYPLTWSLSLFGSLVTQMQAGYSLNTYIGAFIVYTTLSVVLTGWLTIPAGALIGRWLVRSKFAG